MTPFDEMEEEMRWHLEARAADLEQKGLSADEARRRAQLEFGSISRYLEEGRAEQRGSLRERWSLDLSLAWRSWRRQPTWWAAMSLQLAFSVVVLCVAWALLRQGWWETIPVPDAERVMLVRSLAPGLVERDMDWPVNLRHFRAWEQNCRTCEAVGLVGPVVMHWREGKVARRLDGLQVSSGLFAVLGLRLQLGRALQSGEEGSVVISDAFWREHFGADPEILGEPIWFQGSKKIVVGVLSPDAFLPRRESLGLLVALPSRVDVLVAVPERLFPAVGWVGNFDWGMLLKARADLPAVSRELNQILVQQGLAEGQVQTRLRPWHETLAEASAASSAAVAWGAGAWLLLSLLCWRGFAQARRYSSLREEELRTQLGAGPGEERRRRLAEALCLVGPACVAGLLCALLLLGNQGALVSCSALFPKGQSIAWGPQELLAGLLLGALGVLLYCTAKPVGTQRWNLVAQSGIASLLAMASLWGAGVYAETLDRSPGFQREGAIAFQVTTPIGATHTSAQWELENALLRELRRNASISAAATTSRLPLEGEASLFQVRVEGEAPTDKSLRVANWRMVSEDYFTAMGIALREGRAFRRSDEGQPVALLSAAAARAAFGTQSALGRRIHYNWNGQPVLLEILGVVGDVRAERAAAEWTPMVYLLRRPEAGMARDFVVRGAGAERSLVDAAREAVRRVHPEARVHGARTLASLVEESHAEVRWLVGIGALLGLAAVAATCLGMVAMVSHGVRARRAEIGLRRALGATRLHLARRLCLEFLAPVSLGLLLAALAGVALLPGATWLAIPGATCGILFSSALAAYLPAREGVAMELREALRSQG